MGRPRVVGSSFFLIKPEKTGRVITLTEEEAKNRGDRTNSKFAYDLNPLCPNSESEITKPGVLTVYVHEINE